MSYRIRTETGSIITVEDKPPELTRTTMIGGQATWVTESFYQERLTFERERLGAEYQPVPSAEPEWRQLGFRSFGEWETARSRSATAPAHAPEWVKAGFTSEGAYREAQRRVEDLRRSEALRYERAIEAEATKVTVAPELTIEEEERQVELREEIVAREARGQEVEIIPVTQASIEEYGKQVSQFLRERDVVEEERIEQVKAVEEFYRVEAKKARTVELAERVIERRERLGLPTERKELAVVTGVRTIEEIMPRPPIEKVKGILEEIEEAKVVVPTELKMPELTPRREFIEEKRLEVKRVQQELITERKVFGVGLRKLETAKEKALTRIKSLEKESKAKGVSDDRYVYLRGEIKRGKEYVKSLETAKKESKLEWKKYEQSVSGYAAGKLEEPYIPPKPIGIVEEVLVKTPFKLGYEFGRLVTGKPLTEKERKALWHPEFELPKPEVIAKEVPLLAPVLGAGKGAQMLLEIVESDVKAVIEWERTLKGIAELPSLVTGKELYPTWKPKELFPAWQPPTGIGELAGYIRGGIAGVPYISEMPLGEAITRGVGELALPSYPLMLLGKGIVKGVKALKAAKPLKVTYEYFVGVGDELFAVKARAYKKGILFGEEITAKAFGKAEPVFEVTVAGKAIKGLELPYQTIMDYRVTMGKAFKEGVGVTYPLITPARKITKLIPEKITYDILAKGMKLDIPEGMITTTMKGVRESIDVIRLDEDVYKIVREVEVPKWVTIEKPAIGKFYDITGELKAVTKAEEIKWARTFGEKIKYPIGRYEHVSDVKAMKLMFEGLPTKKILGEEIPYEPLRLKYKVKTFPLLKETYEVSGITFGKPRIKFEEVVAAKVTPEAIKLIEKDIYWGFKDITPSKIGLPIREVKDWITEGKKIMERRVDITDLEKVTIPEEALRFELPKVISPGKVPYYLLEEVPRVRPSVSLAEMYKAEKVLAVKMAFEKEFAEALSGFEIKSLEEAYKTIGEYGRITRVRTKAEKELISKIKPPREIITYDKRLYDAWMTVPGVVTPRGVMPAIKPRITERDMLIPSVTKPRAITLIEEEQLISIKPTQLIGRKADIDIGIKPVVEPAVKPIVEPIIKPIIEPAIKPIVEPIIKPIVEPAIKPFIEPIIKPKPPKPIKPIEWELPPPTKWKMPPIWTLDLPIRRKVKPMRIREPRLMPRVRRAVTPSLTAIYFGIKGKPRKKEYVFTGMEVRPITGREAKLLGFTYRKRKVKKWPPTKLLEIKKKKRKIKKKMKKKEKKLFKKGKKISFGASALFKPLKFNDKKLKEKLLGGMKL